jgi:hypothetical protein
MYCDQIQFDHNTWLLTFIMIALSGSHRLIPQQSAQTILSFKNLV